MHDHARQTDGGTSSTKVSVHSGLTVKTSENSCLDWKRDAKDVGISRHNLQSDSDV